jgi:LDH2 family malate/lactate/ureidoglycolate dehydrogenase
MTQSSKTKTNGAPQGHAQDDDRVVLREDDIRRQATAVIRSLGVSEEDAAVAIDVFLQAELMGEESHGLRLLLHVLGRLKAGGDRAATKITVITDRGAIAVWDANRSLGQVTAARAMETAIEKARSHGLGFVTVRNGNSLTSAKYYALMASAEGMIGLVYTNTSRKYMPPPGGRTPVLGNNPVAVAAPAGDLGNFALDMACTAAAVERILRAKELNQPIPSGWALDREGRETTDPAKALESLSLLPFGGYKAFGIGMVHEIVTSVLNGGAIFAGNSTGFMPYDGPMNTSFSLQAIDVSAFMPVEEFKERMSTFLNTIKRSEPRSPGDRILFPGERSQAELVRRREHGIPVIAATYQRLQQWAAEAGVPDIRPI